MGLLGRTIRSRWYAINCLELRDDFYTKSCGISFGLLSNFWETGIKIFRVECFHLLRYVNYSPLFFTPLWQIQDLYDPDPPLNRSIYLIKLTTDTLPLIRRFVTKYIQFLLSTNNNVNAIIAKVKSNTKECSNHNMCVEKINPAGWPNIFLLLCLHQTNNI